MLRIFFFFFLLFHEDVGFVCSICSFVMENLYNNFVNISLIKKGGKVAFDATRMLYS